MTPYVRKFENLEEASTLGNFILSAFLLAPQVVSSHRDIPHTPESLEASRKVHKTLYNLVYSKLKKMEKKGKRIKRVEGDPTSNTIEVDYETKTGEMKHKKIEFKDNGTFINGEIMRLDNDNLINKMRQLNSQFEN
jgi:hypothetical protein